MDFIEFAEKIAGVELLECQKKLLLEMEQLSKHGKVRLLYGGRNGKMIMYHIMKGLNMAEHIKLNTEQVKRIISGESVVMEVNKPDYGEKVTVLLTSDNLDIFQNPRDEAKKIRFVGGYEICPECAAKLGYEYHGRKVCYCLECGQKIVRGV